MKTSGKKKPTAVKNKTGGKATAPALPGKRPPGMGRRRVRGGPSRRPGLWIWIVGGVVALAMAIPWLLVEPDETKTANPGSSGATQTDGASQQIPPESAVSPDASEQREPLAFIQSIRLLPSRPTRMDDLKAEVKTTSAAPEKLVYTYRWKVNDRVIEGAGGDTLNLSAFHKRDLVAVTVTPYDGETAGFAVESPLVAIQPVPPSLELKAMRQPKNLGQPVELQLVGVAPDGDRVIFSLEAPHVPGMTIDRHSGKISWLLQPDRKGVFRFGAGVEDDNGAKVTRIFEITVD